MGAPKYVFVGSKSTISHFGERFRDGQYSLVSFVFAVFILTVPPMFVFVPLCFIFCMPCCEYCWSLPVSHSYVASGDAYEG